MIMTSHSTLLHSTAPNVCDDECTLCDDCSVECTHSLHTLSLRLFCWTRCLHSHFWMNALCLCSVGKMWCPNPFWFAYPYKKCYYLKRLRRETHVVTQFFFSCLLPNAMYVNFCLMLIVEYFWLDVGAIIAGIASQEINRLTVVCGVFPLRCLPVHPKLHLISQRAAQLQWNLVASYWMQKLRHCLLLFMLWAFAILASFYGNLSTTLTTLSDPYLSFV